MKKTAFYLLPLCVSFSISSCGDQTKVQERYQATIDSLTRQLDEKDNSVNEFLKAFNEIEESLLQVQNKQRSIESGSLSAGETNANVKARIEEEIRSINEAMAESRNKMAELQGKLKKSNLKIVELEKMITRLNGSLAEKDAEIASLNEKLIAMNYKVEGLTQEVSTLRAEKQAVTQELETKSREAEEKTTELNTAFYAIGTKKELIDKGVLSKEGIYSGPKARGKLGVSFNEKSFTRVDIRTTSELLLNSKKARLLSSHPAGSFTLTGEKLVISQPQEFWKASKYCVVEIVR